MKRFFQHNRRRHRICLLAAGAAHPSIRAALRANRAPASAHAPAQPARNVKVEFEKRKGGRCCAFAWRCTSDALARRHPEGSGLLTPVQLRDTSADGREHRVAPSAGSAEWVSAQPARGRKTSGTHDRIFCDRSEVSCGAGAAD